MSRRYNLPWENWEKKLEMMKSYPERSIYNPHNLYKPVGNEIPLYRSSLHFHNLSEIYSKKIERSEPLSSIDNKRDASEKMQTIPTKVEQTQPITVEHLKKLYAATLDKPTPRELPRIEIDNKTYFVDGRLRELRNVEKPWEAISFDRYETKTDGSTHMTNELNGRTMPELEPRSERIEPNHNGSNIKPESLYEKLLERIWNDKPEENEKIFDLLERRGKLYG